jgi:ribosomal protein L11 methyltransferase
VLSIAAAKLGAGRIAAIEIDPDTTANAEENVARNEAGAAVHLFEGDAAVLLPLIAPVRVVIANILSSVILELLPAMREALTPDGQAILGGIMLEEREMMLEKLTEAGWLVAQEESEGEWWCAVAMVSA